MRRTARAGMLGFHHTEGDTIKHQSRTTTKGRSAFAALVGVLLLAGLFVGPAAGAARTGAAPVITSTARGVAPLGIGHRVFRDIPRALPRRSAAEHSRLAVAIERATTVLPGSTLYAAVLGAALLVAALVAGFRAVHGRPCRVSARVPGIRRDRAPPALALA